MDDYQIAVLFSVLVLNPMADWKITDRVKNLEYFQRRVDEERGTYFQTKRIGKFSREGI